jgi:hypothetical protein
LINAAFPFEPSQPSQAAQMPSLCPDSLENWTDALTQLDKHLTQALAIAPQLYGDNWDKDANRGLYISEDDTERLLNRKPGHPLFFSDQTTKEQSHALPSRLQQLVTAFGLSAFDCDIILLAIAPEFDLRYERLYAYLQDDVTRKHPTIDLALNLLSTSVIEKLQQRQSFSAESPILRQGLIKLIPDPQQIEPPFLAWYFKLDDRITQFLLGSQSLATSLQSIASHHHLPFPELTLTVEHQQIIQHWASRNTKLRAYLQGETGLDTQEIPKAVAQQLNISLLTIDLTHTPIVDLLPVTQQAVREAQLWGSLLYIAGIDKLMEPDQQPIYRQIWAFLETSPLPILLSGQRNWLPIGNGGGWALLTITPPDRQQRRQYWQQALTQFNLTLSEESLSILASRFRLNRHQIDRAAALACDPTQDSPTLQTCLAAARTQSTQTLSTLAQKLSPKYQWADIILSPDALQLLRDIGDQARYRDLVFETWGFDRKLSLGKGLNALFAGPPGTGKTMAAEVIANDLQLDIYKIDLSQVVSKYIGETEKNLDRIFTAARVANAILFFDEADALFGKRSEVKDAHDRYANIEVGYLLQKMEEYEGIAILATNLRQNMDEAFLRRIQIIIEFPFPDVESRQRIWEVTFPPESPLQDSIDFARLAQEIKLSGGHIKNIALAAAFFAARDQQSIEMKHLLQAAAREHEKLGRHWTPWEIMEAQA